MTIGRNDPCPCGSGLKFKHCCADRRSSPAKNKQNAIGMAVVLIIGLAGLVAAFMNAGGPGVEEYPSTATSVPAAPPGKVWSAEHGHWHDAGAPSLEGFTPVSQPGVAIPQPPGPAPTGKVWSAEHGHWHDEGDPSSGSLEQGGSLVGGGPSYAQPEGPVPEGKAWSADHGHWHDATLPSPISLDPAVPSGAGGPPYTQPEGPVPEGKVWSADHGHWHDAPPAIP